MFGNIVSLWTYEKFGQGKDTEEWGLIIPCNVIVGGREAGKAKISSNKIDKWK